MTKNMMLFFGIILSVSFHMTMFSLEIMKPLRWLKNKFSARPVITRVIDKQEIMDESIYPENFVAIDTTPMVVHDTRKITFTNNMPDIIMTLKDDPKYKKLLDLVDQEIIVNGKNITAGQSADIEVYDDLCMVTIKLRSGIAQLIYAMEQGTMRGILLLLIKHIEPWIQWQYRVMCKIRKNVDSFDMFDIIAQASDQIKDTSAVNHRFKWVLVVELSLNKELTI